MLNLGFFVLLLGFSIAIGYVYLASFTDKDVSVKGSVYTILLLILFCSIGGIILEYEKSNITTEFESNIRAELNLTEDEDFLIEKPDGEGNSHFKVYVDNSKYLAESDRVKIFGFIPLYGPNVSKIIKID